MKITPSRLSTILLALLVLGCATCASSRAATPASKSAEAGGTSTLFSGKQPSKRNAPTIMVAKTESQGIATWQPTFGSGLAQMLITELSSLPNFNVLESVATDDLTLDFDLAARGLVSYKDSARKGDWKGADYLFKSTVTRFGHKENTFGGNSGWGRSLPFGGFGVKNTENEMQIDWRIVSIATREVVASGRAQGIEKGKSFSFSRWSGGGFNNNQEFADSALGKATMKAIAAIFGDVKTLELEAGVRLEPKKETLQEERAAKRNIKGAVSYAAGKEIGVKLGANHGFAKGDKVKIYKPIEKKNSKGEVVMTTYELVAEITLSKVMKDQSVGTSTTAAIVNEGWLAAAAEVDVDQL